MRMGDFEPVIGLEIHAQIATKTKMFCACANDSFGKEANTNVCPICMGFPGMLPVLNKEALVKGVRAAMALGCSIPEASKFDRKNYFYPDLPKGFQISQYDKPVSRAGSIVIEVDGREKKIGINRLHLEDDAGKLTHVKGGTLCDYNRSGCPLMEIVSEPDLRSVQEASIYVQEIRRILRYSSASFCDMEKGMMRFDINISLRKKGTEKFGTKVEVKNLNSFRALERALDYEIERQAEVINGGGSIVQETRGWDDVLGKTISQRSKEEAHDYRYFPEPDLPPLEFAEKEIENIRASLPELPRARRLRFVSQYGLSAGEAANFSEEPAMADYFEAAARESGDTKKSASFISTVLLRFLNRDHRDIGESPVSAQQLASLVKLINEGKISNNQAKGEVFEAMYTTGKSASEIIKEKGLEVVSDSGAIDELCKKIIQANPVPVADYKSGKQTAIGFLVGAVMKESKGRANPALVLQTLKKMIE